MVANLFALGLASPVPMVTNNLRIPKAVSYLGPNVNSAFLLPWIIFKGVVLKTKESGVEVNVAS
jgi:hypothetical protein